MNRLFLSSTTALLLLFSYVHLQSAHAQQAPIDAAGSQATTGSSQNNARSGEWKYQSRRLSRAEVDALLSRPEAVLVLDVRRPDELSKYGGFPVYLNIQTDQLERNLAYIPRDRTILTVSNRAQRAGRVADALAARGFKVAGATGSEDYAAEGGTVTRWAPPVNAASRPSQP